MTNVSDQLILAIIACLGAALMLIDGLRKKSPALLIGSILLSRLCIWLIGGY